MICPKNCNCLFLIVLRSCLTWQVCFRTVSLVTSAVHEMRCIHRRNQSSNALTFLIVSFVIVQDSQPYKNTDHTEHFNKRNLILKLVFLLRRIYSKSTNACLASTILLVISLVDLPLLEISEPRYQKCSVCLSFPSRNHFPSRSYFPLLIKKVMLLLFNKLFNYKRAKTSILEIYFRIKNGTKNVQQPLNLFTRPESDFKRLSASV